MGVSVELPERIPPVGLLFGEDQGRAVVSCRPDDEDDVLRIARGHGLPVQRIGTVGPPGCTFTIAAGAHRVDQPMEHLTDAFFRAIPRRMDRLEESPTSPSRK